MRGKGLFASHLQWGCDSMMLLLFFIFCFDCFWFWFDSICYIQFCYFHLCLLFLLFLVLLLLFFIVVQLCEWRVFACKVWDGSSAISLRLAIRSSTIRNPVWRRWDASIWPTFPGSIFRVLIRVSNSSFTLWPTIASGRCDASPSPSWKCGRLAFSNTVKMGRLSTPNWLEKARSQRKKQIFCVLLKEAFQDWADERASVEVETSKIERSVSKPFAQCFVCRHHYQGQSAIFSGSFCDFGRFVQRDFGSSHIRLAVESSWRRLVVVFQVSFRLCYVRQMQQRVLRCASHMQQLRRQTENGARKRNGLFNQSQNDKASSSSCSATLQKWSSGVSSIQGLSFLLPFLRLDSCAGFDATISRSRSGSRQAGQTAEQQTAFFEQRRNCETGSERLQTGSRSWFGRQRRLGRRKERRRQCHTLSRWARRRRNLFLFIGFFFVRRFGAEQRGIGSERAKSSSERERQRICNSEINHDTLVKWISLFCGLSLFFGSLSLLAYLKNESAFAAATFNVGFAELRSRFESFSFFFQNTSSFFFFLFSKNKQTFAFDALSWPWQLPLAQSNNRVFTAIDWAKTIRDNMKNNPFFFFNLNVFLGVFKRRDDVWQRNGCNNLHGTLLTAPVGTAPKNLQMKKSIQSSFSFVLPNRFFEGFVGGLQHEHEQLVHAIQCKHRQPSFRVGRRLHNRICCSFNHLPKPT